MPETFAEFADDMQRSLAELPASIQESLRLSALRGRNKARAAAPRGRGNLRRSIEVQTEANHAALTMPGRYAPVEFGGTIRPKRSGFLAVPIQPATEVLKGPRTDAADLFFLRSRDGRAFLASKAGGGVELRWRLMRSVTVPGQGFMQKGHKAAADDFEGRALDTLEKAVT